MIAADAYEPGATFGACFAAVAAALALLAATLSLLWFHRIL